ncbi:hypothetical protein DVH24_002711 [Malus domestica]|uniref:Uncharacterized protein n=1 Tax=Malus domestica TaxID=3750 RepID=A0A498KAT8_MALDO|nr:hypothetical protein DVH24_002711 [Malus domestica]
MDCSGWVGENGGRKTFGKDKENFYKMKWNACEELKILQKFSSFCVAHHLLTDSQVHWHNSFSFSSSSSYSSVFSCEFWRTIYTQDGSEAERVKPSDVILGTGGRGFIQSVLQGSVSDYCICTYKSALVVIVPGNGIIFHLIREWNQLKVEVNGVGINTEWGLLMASISEDTGEITFLRFFFSFHFSTSTSVVV